MRPSATRSVICQSPASPVTHFPSPPYTRKPANRYTLLAPRLLHTIQPNPNSVLMLAQLLPLSSRNRNHLHYRPTEPMSPFPGGAPPSSSCW
jgi:hypothetical protein